MLLPIVTEGVSEVPPLAMMVVSPLSTAEGVALPPVSSLNMAALAAKGAAMATVIITGRDFFIQLYFGFISFSYVWFGFDQRERRKLRHPYS